MNHNKINRQQFTIGISRKIILIILCVGFVNPLFAAIQWKAGFTIHSRGINTLRFLDIKTVVVAGGAEMSDSLNAVIKYTDRGETLIQYYDFSEIHPWFTDMFFTAHDTGYLVGWNGHILKTTTAADSWQYKSLPSAVAHRHYNGVYFTDNSTGYMVGGNRENDTIQTILKTINGADTWSIVRDIPGQWLNSIFFISPNIGFCVGAKGTILKTNDAGNSWVRNFVSGDAGTRNFTRVFFKNNTIGFIIGGSEKDSNVQTILKTTDGGNNWHVLIDSIGGQMLNGIGFMDTDTGYVVGNSGVIKKTTDGGSNWLDFYLPEDINDSFRDLKAVYFFNKYGGGFGGETGKFILYQDSIPQGAGVRMDSVMKKNDRTVALYGQVNPNGNPTHVFFEYGSTPAMGNTITILPDSLLGNTTQTVSAHTPVLPPGTYYCRLRGINKFGDSLSNMLLFRVNIPGVWTGGASINANNTALLQGIVNPEGFGAHVIFEYGETESFGSSITVVPDSVYGTTEQMVSATTPVLGVGLYYYRIRAFNRGGDSAGTLLQFRIGIPDIITGNVTSGDVVIYRDNSVKLTGWLNPRGNTVHPFFEYGLTPALGDTINAIPNSITGTSFSSVYALTSVLNPGIYYYRLHISFDGGDTSGSIRQFYIGDNPIPNFDFEYWSIITDSVLTGGWLTNNSYTSHPVYRSISYDGSTSIVLSAEGLKDGFSIIILGKLKEPEDGLGGGMPLNARPDSLIGYFKYDLKPGHPASWGYVLKKDGNYITPDLPTPPYLFRIPKDSTGPYSTNGQFVRMAFPMVYTDAVTIPDTIILGFLTNDLNIMFTGVGEVAPENILEIDNLAFTGAAVTIPNSGFENWQVNSLEYPSSWKTVDLEGSSYSGVFSQVFKTADARNGQYAAKIYNTSGISFGRNLLYSDSDPFIKPAFPVSHKFTGLNGYYKLNLENNLSDTAVIFVTIFKNGLQIGSGTLYLTNDVTSYRPFYDSITYNADYLETPDSANIVIYFLNRAQSGNGQSVLYLDDLSFDGLRDTAFVISGTTYISPPAQILHIYPNPASAFVAFLLPEGIREMEAAFFDSNGTVFQAESISTNYKDLYLFNVVNLPNAIYFMRILTDQGVFTGKFIKISDE